MAGWDQYKAQPKNLSEALLNAKVIQDSNGPGLVAPAGSTDNSIWGQLRGWCTVFGFLGAIAGSFSGGIGSLITGIVAGIVVGALFVALLNVLSAVLGPVVRVFFDTVERVLPPRWILAGAFFGAIAGFVVSGLVGMQGLVGPFMLLGVVFAVGRGYLRRARGLRA